MRFCDLIRHDGNEALFRAIEMSVLSTRANQPFHVHAEGLRGTGKTTVMRAVKDALPTIRRVRGCVYNCDPEAPHCPEHRQLRSAELAEIGVEEITMPFLEISHSAKVGTVVGSIDLAKVMHRDTPEAALLPGSIPMANRGILFVDEINRLAEIAPELADVLLSVMGTKPGRLQIEETGLCAVQMPVNVSVWAASNPDEEPGPLENIRRQLSDRFDACVEMARPTSIVQVISIIRKGMGAARQTASGYTRGLIPAKAAIAMLDTETEEIIARLYMDFGLESLRAAESLAHAARLRATIKGRDSTVPSDVREVALLVLRHRVELSTLNRIMNHLQNVSERDAVAGQIQAQTPVTPKPTEREAPTKPETRTDDLPPSDRLSRLLDSLKATLRGTKKPESGQPNGAETEQQTFNTPAAFRIGDPMRSDLATPQTRATPIADLPQDRIVTTAEELRNADNAELG